MIASTAKSFPIRAATGHEGQTIGRDETEHRHDLELLISGSADKCTVKESAAHICSANQSRHVVTGADDHDLQTPGDAISVRTSPTDQEPRLLSVEAVARDMQISRLLTNENAMRAMIAVPPTSDPLRSPSELNGAHAKV